MNLLPKKYLFCHLLILIVFSGCSLEKTGLRELKKLCEKDAGLTIYKTVEADGYYDSTADSSVWVSFVKSKFKFIEFCDENPSFVREITEPGCWRLSKVSRESDLCYLTIDKKLQANVIEPYASFKKSHCVSVEKFDSREKRYIYESRQEKWLAGKGDAYLVRSEHLILDIGKDKVLGRYISYAFNPHPGQVARKSCHHIDDKYTSYREANLINKIIR